MTLLAPAILAGLVGLALPVIAHLLGREPPTRIRFAAVRFLAPTEQAVTHRRQVQDPLLLLVRLVLLALVIVILARPASTDSTAIAVVAEPHDAIIVVDGSRSMQLRVDGQTLLEHAHDQIETLTQAIPAGSRVGLVTSDPDGPVIELSADFERPAAAVAEWTEQGAPRAGAWPLRDAIPSAAALLRQVPADRKRVIYAIGDGTETGLGSLPSTAEGGVLVLPIPAIDPDTPRPGHVSIDQVAWSPAPDIDPRAVRIEAVVHRHPPSSPGEDEGEVPVVVALRIGDKEVARTTIQTEAGRDEAVEFTHTLLEEAGTAAASVALVDLDADPLPSDDVRHLWLTADDALEIVVVNGDPSELRVHDEVFFLSTAIASADDSDQLHLRSVAPEQVEADLRARGQSALRGADVLVLANVRALAPDVAPIVVEAVRGGMGLWFAVGDRVEPDVYNDRFGDLLPLLMRQQVEVGTAPGRTEARVEGVGPADLSHPAFTGLGGDLGVSGTRARKIILLEPDPKRGPEIALSFTSGAPAVLTRTVGVGRVALLTTTLDRDWSDLPLRPGFVPLIANMLRYLGAAEGGVAGTQIRAGDPKVIRTTEPVRIRTPSGRELGVAPATDGAATFTETYEVGHYQVVRGDDTDVFATAVDPIESQVAWSDVDTNALEDDGEQVRVAVPRWRELVAVVALLLLLETLLRWRRRQGTRR